MRNLNVMTLNGLRAVEAVGRLGSLQAASDELGVTIGAVSQQVIKCETQLGRSLFAREPRGLVVLPGARDFVTRLTEAFGGLSRAVDWIRHEREDVLTISVAPVFAARWLVFRLGQFAELYPDIRIRLDATDRLIDPNVGDVDLCIRVGKGRWSGVQAHLLLQQQVFPVCSPAMASKLSTPADILDMPWVVDARAMFSRDLWLGRAGLPIGRVVARHVFNEASLCLDAVIAGQGVMLAWQTLASHAIQSGQLVVPFGPFLATGDAHYLVTAENAARDPKVEAFEAWLRQALKDDMAALNAFVRTAGIEPAAL
ncbi:LysR family transcriptional regulator [Ciceribacter sp. L1K23]|uniref:LysR substrate-binding domain-containing protein n=1 Tax=Ciceribacter sp. L1K23 TaxID=2820276 RepID=UPI001B82963B|nr:LysR substrate-binding domain-containing protein [Ciceribacter sp. L1K23]MBR0557195.1 LysR family transcriptional regulator [Ciceribacter sp. L1K23]